jgi:hypothetical protein
MGVGLSEGCGSGGFSPVSHPMQQIPIQRMASINPVCLINRLPLETDTDHSQSLSTISLYESVAGMYRPKSTENFVWNEELPLTKELCGVPCIPLEAAHRYGTAAVKRRAESVIHAGDKSAALHEGHYRYHRLGCAMIAGRIGVADPGDGIKPGPMGYQ